MSKFIPVIVYTNLVKLMGYRGMVIENPPMDDETVAQKLSGYEFATIRGTRQASDIRGAASLCIALVAPGSKYAAKSTDFKKLLKGLVKQSGGAADSSSGQTLQIMIVTENVLTIHIKKYIEVFRGENPSTRIEDYDYTMFMLEAPAHVSVPRHIIMTPIEVNELCDYYYTTKDRFPKISERDAQAVWLGIRPGMVVKIIRDSENAGTAIGYRVCVRG